MKAWSARSGAQRPGPLGPLLAASLGVASCASTPPLSSPGLALPEGSPGAGREAFVRLGCVECHRVAGDASLPAPSRPVPFVLGERGSSLPTDERLVNGIVHPDHVLRMPNHPEVRSEEGASRMRDYADVMRVRELVDLVAYLRAAYRESWGR